ncbi:MAG: hypothetical protein IIZ06_07530 [Kiritimatiellae bacterium]|nr:hypothetical protein [Kiritimatiellia bacterium]
MTAHRQILTAVATAIASSEAVKDFAVANFGRGLDVHVGAYAAQFPGEDDSPFLWITPREENEAIKDDDLFEVRFVVGGCVKGANGEKVINNVVTPRTATTNGLTINGGNAIVEELRDVIMYVARNAAGGAIVNRIRREENDISHFPLEWATFYIEYLEPECLASALADPAPTNDTEEASA